MPVRSGSDSDFDQEPRTREQILFNELITTLGEVGALSRFVLNSLDRKRVETAPYARTGGELRGAFDTMQARIRSAEALAELIVAERKAQRTQGEPS